MRILHVVNFYPEFGGPFTSTMALLSEMSRQGIQIYVISPLPKNYRVENLDFVKNLNFEVHYIRTGNLSSIWPSFSMEFFKEIPYIAKQVDLIHLHGLFDMYSIPVFLTKTKFIISLHGIFMKYNYYASLRKRLKKNFFLFLLGKKILYKAAKIRVSSWEEKSHFESFFPNLSDKTVIIANCINLEMYFTAANHRSKNSVSTKDHRKKILFLGRLTKSKGLEELINGFSHILRERKDLELLIAGKDSGDGYEYKIRKLVRHRGIENFVKFLGFVRGENKISLLSKVDLFVLPSYSENFGVSIVEAMASGVPVIISNRVGISSDIKERKAGIIIEPTEEGVYKGIKQWLSMSREAIEEMKEKAIETVSELYDVRTVARTMINLYQNLLSGADKT